ncbi:MAG: flagellar biosynthesis protein FlhA [Acidobacteria bacterium]|nr:flagellar biosynthesis protein FlhA [Acidobacteriota bacterium]MBI3662998.1 flagellar biosynthesis protein FlhA [Acidobacteriota bacterium]
MTAKVQTIELPAQTATDWFVPLGAVVVVFVMLVPLPAMLLDVMLSVNITASVLVLLSAMYILRPVQFSVFPSLLLLLTLYRLSLNLASSRRILLHGNEGASAAGRVIEAFGQFVVGGNYVVGFVLFLALIAIQYIVINHGAVRIAEVTARFNLDALPGKQMAIDADLNAGLIDEAQARSRREQITREADFYGAMDGAARFSQRDSLATVLITAINIVAGFLIGVFQLDIPFQDALKTYTVLTVGDGLVTMIPSLLVSVAGGMIATRASSQASLGLDLGEQLMARSRPLWIAAGVMMALALIPGLPKFSFVLAAAGAGALAWRAGQKKTAQEAAAAAAAAPAPASTQEQLDTLLKLDDLSVEIGYGLVPLVDEKQSGQLLQRIRALRRHLALQLGFLVPSIHITDNLRLKAREYVVLLRGVEVARWEMEPDCLLAISSEAAPPNLEGIITHEPAFGVAARWIAPALQQQALAAGYAVVDQTSVMATHIAEIVKQYAHELLTRQESKRLLDTLAAAQPKLVEELVPRVLSLGEVQKVLQSLLREQVSIRDLPTILETLLDVSAVTKNPVLMVEAARQALARALVRPLMSDDGKLKVLTLDPEIEGEIVKAFDPNAAASASGALQPSFLRRLLESLRGLLGEQLAAASPVVLCSSPARYHLRRMLEPFLPRLVVLAPTEIPTVVAVQSLGVLR